MSGRRRPTNRDRITRRKLLGQVATVGGGLLVFSSCSKAAKAVPPAVGGASLSAEELALCTAACERVLPADRDPGATQLGVTGYIDRRLARSGRRALQARRRFRKGLTLLSEWSVEQHGRAFLALDADTQDIALASLAAEGGPDGYGFVRQLVELTLEGAFADPSYGGNRDGAGWKLVGFDAPCPNPRCP